MFNKTAALSKADKEMGDFKPYKKGLYILSVKEAIAGEVEGKTWAGTGFVGTGEMIPQLTLIFSIMNPDGTNLISDIDGKESVNPSFRSWIDESNLGWNKKKNEPKQGRAILAALLGVAPDGDISFENPDYLIGKQISVFMGIYTKKNGTEGNELLNIDPIK